MSNGPTLPALDPERLEPRLGSLYPAAWAAACGAREKRALGDPLGLTAFGANLVRLPPGALSSQRHWHSHEDEFVYMLEGKLVLVTQAGEQILTPGMVAAFPAGKADGHHLVNRSEAWATYLEVGSRSPEDETHYPDIDLYLSPEGRFCHKNGEPY